MSWGVRGWPGVGWLLGRLMIDGGTVNRSLPVLRLKQRWANATQAFTAASVEVTDNGSASGSLLQDWRVGANSVLSIDKAGIIRGLTGTTISLTNNAPMINASSGVFIGGATTGCYVETVSNSSRVIVRGDVGVFGWTATNNVYSGIVTQIARDADHVINQRNGTNGQIARWSRTHTDANNYERVELDCSTNTFRFGPRALGTGTARVLYLETGSTTVASLASAATVGTGARAFVTDATASTFASVVAGGGSNRVPVYSDGTDWRIG
jgi:hypothetical protein